MPLNGALVKALPPSTRTSTSWGVGRGVNDPNAGLAIRGEGGAERYRERDHKGESGRKGTDLEM